MKSKAKKNASEERDQYEAPDPTDQDPELNSQEMNQSDELDFSQEFDHSEEREPSLDEDDPLHIDDE